MDFATSAIEEEDDPESEQSKLQTVHQRCNKYEKNKSRFELRKIYSVKEIAVSDSSSEEETHSACLTIVKKIEFVHQLIDVVGSSCQCAEIHDETNVVRLCMKLFLEQWILNDRQTMTERESLAQDLVIWLEFSGLHILHVFENEFDS